jgi:hypothetical protein
MTDIVEDFGEMMDAFGSIKETPYVNDNSIIIENLLDSLSGSELLNLIEEIKDEQELRKLKSSRQKKLKSYLKKERKKIVKELDDLSEEEEKSKLKSKKILTKNKK